MNKFKKILKADAKSGLVYFVQHEENYFIGSRHYMIRIQHLTDKLRAMLAECGLFQPNMAVNMGQTVNAPDISKVFPVELTGFSDVTWTSLHYQSDKLNMRLGACRSDLIAANTDYIDAMEDLFNQTEWKQKDNLAPIILGNRLALILPFRVGNGIAENLDILTKMKHPVNA